jgi:hypothetical protein
MKKFLYYILKEDGRSGKVVNGVVTFSGVPTPLPQTPDGWQELLLSWERSIDKHGVIIDESLPLGFVRDGALIIRDTLYKNSIEEKLFILIQKLTIEYDGLTFNWLYNFLYKGELNLIKSSDADDMFSVPADSGGLKKLIEANGKTVYEFPVTDPKAKGVYNDGIKFFNSSNFSLIDGLEIGNADYGGFWYPPFTFINADGTNGGVALSSQTLENINGLSYDEKLQSSNWFAQAAPTNQDTINIRIQGDIIFTCIDQDASNGFIMRFLRSNLLLADQAIYQLFIDSPLVNGTTYTHAVDVTIPLEPGERCYLEGYLGFTGTDTKIEFEPNSNLKVTYEFTNPASTMFGFRRIDLFKLIMFQISGNEDHAVSQLLEDDYDIILSGDSIRGIEEAKIYTSLDDLFKDVDATFMAGQAIYPDRVEIEDRINYYTEQDEVDLGIVKDFKKVPAQDLMCNTFKFGHPKQSIEDVNGKYDPNGTNKFIGPITRVTKEYDGASPYKAGPYEIELLRVNLDGKTTTDDNKDKQCYVVAAVGEPATQNILLSFSSAGNYIVFPATPKVAVGTKFKVTGTVNSDKIYEVTKVEGSTIAQTVYTDQTISIAEFTVNATVEFITKQVYLLDRPAYTLLEGVPTDTIFNLSRLTPKTMFNRHKRWIKSMNAGLLSKIKFSNGEENKNTELKTILAGVTVDEDADESISGFGDYIFLPWYFIFKTDVPVSLPELIEENPNRTYKFTDEYNNEWRGFLRIAAMAPNDYTPQEFRLLATPTNDIKKLIHG